MTVRLITRDENALEMLVAKGFILQDDRNRPGFPFVQISKGEPSPDVLAGIDMYLGDAEYELTARFTRDLRGVKEAHLEFEPGQFIAIRCVTQGMSDFDEDPDTYEFTIRVSSVCAMNTAYRMAYQFA